MITGEIKNRIDKIWDTFWTGGITNSLTVFEQMTYLFFMKQHVSNMACGDSVAAFIRSQIGVDRTIAVQRFSNFIQGAALNSAQEEFIKSIVTYVCENGDIKVETLIEEDPFKEYDLIDVFGQKTKGVRDYVIDIHDLIAG